jgi:proline dehydrogenase
MLLRNALLFLSRRRGLRKVLERSSLTRRVVRRFVAGETLDAAIQVSHRLRAEGILVTLDRLGENVSTEAEADASLAAGLETLARIHQDALPATISIKLTQFGLDLSESGCLERVRRLAASAHDIGTGIEIDMESHPYVDRTLAIVRDIHARHGNVRSVIQAYLYRSERDVEQLCGERIPVRLCKGAYLEPADVAFPKKKDVDANFMHLMIRLLRCGPEPALATHDPRILRQALQLIQPAVGAEFQMLYGVRRDLQRKLVAAGKKLRLYVPYGAAWYPYFMRRLAERPANVLFLVRNLFRN